MCREHPGARFRFEDEENLLFKLLCSKLTDPNRWSKQIQGTLNSTSGIGSMSVYIVLSTVVWSPEQESEWEWENQRAHHHLLLLKTSRNTHRSEKGGDSHLLCSGGMSAGFSELLYRGIISLSCDSPKVTPECSFCLSMNIRHWLTSDARHASGSVARVFHHTMRHQTFLCSFSSWM